jgi:hypothetical protein
MTKRRRRLLAGLAVLALLGVLALPGVHWRLVGWWRGEPVYRGRPASFYADTIRSCFPYGSLLVARTQTPSEQWVRRFLPDCAADLVWGGPPPFEEPPDASAVPVLLALMADADPAVRYRAVWAVDITVDPPPSVVPALVGMLDDADVWVRALTADALGRRGPAGQAVGRLKQLLHEPICGVSAKLALFNIAPDALKDADRP